MTQSAFSTGRETVAGDVRARMAMSMATILIAVCSVAAPAFAQCQYEVTAIITPDDENACFPLPPSPTFGQGMNIHADVVGFYWPCALGNDEAFFWSEETGFVTLPKPPGVTRAWAYDISDTRLIVGQHEISGVGRKGFVYDMNKNDGQFMYLEPLHDGVTGQNVSSANAVNSNGLVAGSRSISKPGEPNVYNAVIWRPFERGSPVEDLGVIEGPNSSALDITDAGSLVVGWDGFSVPTTIGYVWDNGNVIELGPVPGTDSSHANAVNSESVVIGSGMKFVDFTWRAFILNQGKMIIVPPIAPFTRSRARGINDHGQVGIMMSEATGSSRGFLWQNWKLYDLNNLLVESTSITIHGVGDLNKDGRLMVSIGTSAALLSPADVPIGDLNFDCKVNIDDLLLLLDAWGPQPAGAAGAKGALHPADLNGDGIVNVIDLLILLEHFTL